MVEEASVFQIVRLFQIARMEAEDEGFVEVIKNKQRANWCKYFILDWGQRERRFRRSGQFSDPCFSSWNPWGFRETMATPSSHRLCSCLACSCDLHYMGPCLNIIRQLWLCHLIYLLLWLTLYGPLHQYNQTIMTMPPYLCLDCRHNKRTNIFGFLASIECGALVTQSYNNATLFICLECCHSKRTNIFGLLAITESACE